MAHVKTDFGLITQEKVKGIVSYDPITGLFTRIGKLRTNSKRMADSLGSQGYSTVFILGNSIQSHRLAWFYTCGEWPKNEIDHINGQRSDNRLCNLRLVTKAENQWNRGKNRNNTTGYKGVVKRGNRYLSQITHQGTTWKAKFDTAEQAGEAYLAAAKILHQEYARV